MVNDPSLISERQVTATLAVFAADQRIFNASAQVELSKSRPNGPSCDPTVYVATVKASSGGELLATP
jgi:hypothetical protein